MKLLKRRSGRPVRRLGGDEIKLGRDLGGEPLVARQSEQKIDPVGLAPGHQVLPREAAVGAQQDARARPAGADAGDDTRHLLDRAGGRIQVGAPQLGEEQMAAAEHVERQIAVAVVIAVEEPPLLLAVQRIIRRIEVENDPFGRSRMRLQEQVDQEILYRHRIVADLVVARRRKLAQLQPVERRLAGHRCAVLAPRLKLARQHRHQRIAAQFVVVVEVLVAERDPKHPLADQRRDLVLDQVRPPLVVKARRKPLRHSDRPIRRSQKQRARFRRHQAGIECRFHSATFNGSKIKLFCATLCRHRGSFRISAKSLQHNDFR